MKIGDIAKISEDKTDHQKITDLLRSGQSITTATNTYKLMHAAGLDYDAAFSKSSQERSGKDEPKDPRDTTAANIDARARQQQDVAKKKADKQKNKGEFKRDADQRKKKGIDSSDYTIDPKTGQMYAKGGGSFYGNQYTGSLGLGRIKNLKRYVDNPSDILSLGADDVESSIGRGAAAGAAIGTIRGAGRRKQKFSLKDF